MLDLNKLIAPGSGLQLLSAININERGEILVKTALVGTPPSDDEDLGHVALLVPCDDDDSPCENSSDSNAVQMQRPVTRAVTSAPRRAAPSPKLWESYRAAISGKAFPER